MQLSADKIFQKCRENIKFFPPFFLKKDIFNTRFANYTSEKKIFQLKKSSNLSHWQQSVFALNVIISDIFPTMAIARKPFDLRTIFLVKTFFFNNHANSTKGNLLEEENHRPGKQSLKKIMISNRRLQSHLQIF